MIIFEKNLFLCMDRHDYSINGNDLSMQTQYIMFEQQQMHEIAMVSLSYFFQDGIVISTIQSVFNVMQ